MPRTWYAITYAYGRAVVNRGARADHIHRFASKGARDAFIDTQERDGADTDAITATHALVKRAQRYAAHGLEWPISVMSGE